MHAQSSTPTLDVNTHDARPRWETCTQGKEIPITKPSNWRSEQQRRANRPSIAITAPLRSRHALDGLTGGRRTRLAERNSIALPQVDMVADTALIREGHADYIGDNRWRVNDRTYAMEGSGAMFPVGGNGIVTLNRREFKALTTLIRYNGDEARARQELGPSPEIEETDILVALALYRQRSSST